MAKRFRFFVVLGCVALAAWGRSSAQTPDAVLLRGHPQQLVFEGPTSGQPVVISSGDGGWIHLAPQVASFLRQRGFFVVGFDVRAYLSAFTTNSGVLSPADEPADYKVLADVATRITGKKPILIGVSEGAGLSVLAATDPQTKSAIRGVIALGLPDLNELGWRWKDSLIYLTHRTPAEPTFSVAAIVANVAPMPLAAIHSRHDEYVPLDEAQRVLAHAREPKRFWIVDASNHRFSDNQAAFEARLLEAIAWVLSAAPG
jgi:pimeloyl-ACP methyl ester carboxylesterase